MKLAIVLIILCYSLNIFASKKFIGKNVDVIIVVDNSGSMGKIQQNIIKNAAIFFEEFAHRPYINWKIGIISTDKNDSPYLGFNSSFDWSMIDYRDPKSFESAIVVFNDAINRLGTFGDANEFIFYNLKKSIDQNPQFLRANADLAVIMISDESEQSEKVFGKQYNVENFYNSIKSKVSSDHFVKFYGALSSNDLDRCEPNSSGKVENYKGSSFESIITQSNGFNISACSDNFGHELAKISHDIIQSMN